jgi:hypothetical protein
MRNVRVVRVRGINRLVAAVLAVVWAAAGAIGVIAALRYGHALAGVAALFAFAYAAAWALVASRARLVSWRELLRPWRAL